MALTQAYEEMWGDTISTKDHKMNVTPRVIGGDTKANSSPHGVNILYIFGHELM